MHVCMLLGMYMYACSVSMHACFYKCVYMCMLLCLCICVCVHASWRVRVCVHASMSVYRCDNAGTGSGHTLECANVHMSVTVALAARRGGPCSSPIPRPSPLGCFPQHWRNHRYSSGEGRWLTLHLPLNIIKKKSMWNMLLWMVCDSPEQQIKAWP